MTAVPGDRDLEGRLESRLGPRHRMAAVGTVTPDATTVACLGAEPDADFEIGSISKGVTGLLYAEAVERGEVRVGSTLGELLPLPAVPVAGVTLSSLAVHRSGLPGLPRAAAPLRRTVELWRHGTNPYGDTLAELLDQASTVRVRRPRATYSNLGFELLGHALAAAAGRSYAELVRDRLAEPLGLVGMYVPATPAELRTTAVAGRSRTGRAREPWTGEALGPAGGVRASIVDMARLAGALLDGSAPGVGALDPVRPFVGATRIGAAWIALDRAGREITWHNGGTGGFRSWIGLDREAGTGVVLLAATALSVDRHGFDLLSEITRASV